MENTFFFHGKTSEGQKFTIAGEFSKSGIIFKDKNLSLGISLCSSNDHFVKETGRVKALGRLKGRGDFAKQELRVKNSEKSDMQLFMDQVVGYNEMSRKALQKIFNLHDGKRRTENKNS
jgi:hypothetical protein